MLKVPQLDDLTYEQRVNRSISRIPAMTDQWTDFNSHDPGITVIQTYAWLTDMLNYYMNATGDVHVQKYLKLLGIEQQPARPSEGFLVIEELSQPVRLSKGTRFFAGEIPFELMEDTVCECNRFCSYIQETDGNGMDLTAFAGTDGEFTEVFAEQFTEASAAYFGFEKPLKDADRLYINVKPEKKRNPFGTQFQFCTLTWEYYTKDGWKPLEVTDETSGFLKSGLLQVHLEEPMEGWHHPQGNETAYYIRCILKENAYDAMPLIGKIYVNPLGVVQKETVCHEGETLEQLQIGTTDGCADQKVLFDYPDVWQFSLLLVDEKQATKELWTMTEHLEEADYKARVFHYDPESRMICFGDGIHGMVPVQGQKICVTALELSRLDQGNVLPGEIRTTDCAALKEARFYNPEAASGGRAAESLSKMRRRLEDTLFVQNRLASEEDYERIILGTPGLMLDLVHVIPGSVYGELHRQNRGQNEIMVVVKPYSRSLTPKLSKAYQSILTEYIEQYRLINTKVTVVSPGYVGIEVHAKIRLQSDTQEAREAVECCIRRAVDHREKEKPFGAVISYGKLFTALEALEEVKRVEELSMEKNGAYAVKNDRGDILCQEDALSYAERMEIEFC